ncbi:RNA polymerase III subunit Rpc25-domain-containing protein [Mycena albidolilacea]|uniref:RNA polymerase III subunit Rpc25-domain-containing protein n=1 Tax=Mycena albidolilacea TaxID=1033008 RepID=A0AAD7ADS0_9AGAR|nr:RNA polymerase III subunit Rpc25-domain-containing protein [Mycena albidolilacea]
MFNLAILKDTVAVHPSDFGGPQEQVIIAELNKKYANRVLHDVGLCICVFDITEAGEGKVRYGDGFLWYKVIFRMVIFRPFTSEVLLAKVMSSDRYGIRLTLGFFDDIYVPIAYLPHPNAFDPNEPAHFWLPNAEETTELLDSPTVDRMWIDKGEVVRVRIEADEFYDDEPGPVKMADGLQVVREVQARAPFTITASMAEQGLGPTSWWSAAQLEEGAEGDDGAMDEG